MIQQIIFGINIVSFILIIISIIFISRAKKFEKDNLRIVFSMVLIGLSFIAVVIAHDSLLSSMMFSLVADRLANIPLNLLFLAIELAIIPIAALSFLIGLMYLREI